MTVYKPLTDSVFKMAIGLWFDADAKENPKVNGVKPPPTDVLNSNIYIKYGPIHQWDTTAVTNMSSAFDQYMNDNALYFNQPLHWNTSNVTDMKGMFINCAAFNQPLDWNVSNVTDMSHMFLLASSFNQDISNFKFNAPNKVNIVNMFSETALSKSNHELNNKIYNTLLNKGFTSAMLSSAGLNVPASSIVVAKPMEISYSLADGKINMRDGSGNVINTPVKLSLKVNFELSM